jgi:glucose-6-phosphate 1-epimerase
MIIVDSHWQRKIEISSENCQQWVLWNPGTELANTMADVHSGGEQEYVCLEAANSKWQELPAGETVIITQEIKVSNL